MFVVNIKINAKCWTSIDKKQIRHWICIGEKLLTHMYCVSS